MVAPNPDSNTSRRGTLGGSSGASSSLLNGSDPLTESERQRLLRVIEERKRELAQKRKALATSGDVDGGGGHHAGGGGSRTLGAPGTGVESEIAVQVVTAASLLEQVKTAVETARRTPRPVRPETGQAADDWYPMAASRSASTGECVPSARLAGYISPTPARYSKALKRALKNLQKQPGVADIRIVPAGMIDKGYQCSLPISTGAPCSPDSKNAALGDDVSTVRREGDPSRLLPVGASSTRAGVVAGPREVPPTFAAMLTTPPHHAEAEQLLNAIAVSPEKITLPVAEVPVKELSSEEAEQVLHSYSFRGFFDDASRLVERALGEEDMFDVFADLRCSLDDSDQRSSVANLRKVATYKDITWTSQRPILQLQSHPSNKSIILAAYGSNRDASRLDPDGCVLLWNVAVTGRPEYVFISQSRVCTAALDVHHPNIIVGGTYTGSVVLWDTRAKSRPVQRTSLSLKSHHHPIYSLKVVGTEHAYNLVTADNDGRLCVWSIAMLVHPTETLDLKRQPGGKDIACSCLAFQENETNEFVAGTQDGSIVSGQIHGSTPGVVDVHSGHSALITSLDWKTSRSRATDSSEVHFSDLMLSSSFDWSIKLWSPKNRSSPLAGFDAASHYCTDVKWHPAHPAVFGSSQADGTLILWDMNRDMEAPVLVQQIAEGDSLTRLEWSLDGSRLATGSGNGVLSLWSVSPSVSQPKTEDFNRFATRVESLRSTVDKI